MLIMVFPRPAVSVSTYAMIGIGSLAEVAGGVWAQIASVNQDSSSIVSPGTALMVATTGMVTAIGGIVLGVMQILAANRKQDALHVIEMEKIKHENSKMKEEIIRNRGWLTTLLNKKHGEELGREPLYDLDPDTATPQALASVKGNEELNRPAPILPPTQRAIDAAVKSGLLPALLSGQGATDADRKTATINKETADTNKKTAIINNETAAVNKDILDSGAIQGMQSQDSH